VLRNPVPEGMGKHHQGREAQVMAKIPQGIQTFKGAWGTSYSYKGIQISKGSGRYSLPYEFKVGKERVLAKTLVEAVREIERIIQEEAK